MRTCQAGQKSWKQSERFRRTSFVFNYHTDQSRNGLVTVAGSCDVYLHNRSSSNKLKYSAEPGSMQARTRAIRYLETAAAASYRQVLAVYFQ